MKSVLNIKGKMGKECGHEGKGRLQSLREENEEFVLRVQEKFQYILR